MSDRYETPRWDDEPEELGRREVLAEEVPEQTVEPVEPDLDASSENVLDGWPAAGTAPPEAEPEAEAEAEAAARGRG